MTRSQRRRPDDVFRCERGVAALEFALLGLVFVLLIVGILEFGRALNTRNDIARAVDAGARTLYIHPAYTETQVQSVVKGAMATNSAALNVRVTSPATSGPVTYRTIEAEYPLTLLMLNHLASPITLRLTRRVTVDGS